MKRFHTLRSTLRRSFTPRRSSLRLKRCGRERAGKDIPSSLARAVNFELEHLHLRSINRSGNERLGKQLDEELKMRKDSVQQMGTSASITERLEAAKSLLASNYRVKAIMEESSRPAAVASESARPAPLPHTRQSREVAGGGDAILLPSPSGLTLSEIRVPLMWRDSDHFKNKGNYRRFSAFCLVRVGSQVRTTALVSNIDRSMTDITFNDVIDIDEVPQDFVCHLDIFAYEHVKDLSIASKQTKLRKRLSDLSNTALRRMSGRQPKSGFGEAGSVYAAPVFSPVAETVLSLSDASSGNTSYDLVLNADLVELLPVFGNFSCTFCARYDSAVKPLVQGYASIKGDGLAWKPYWCSLTACRLDCWRQKPERLSTYFPADLSLNIGQQTRVRVVDDETEDNQTVVELTDLLDPNGGINDTSPKLSGKWLSSCRLKLDKTERWTEILRQLCLDKRD